MNTNTFHLPDEAVAFLRAGRQLEYDHSLIEAGEVKLKRLDELTQGEVWTGTDMTGDPHAGEDGYYAIPAVSLTGECQSYEPEFILLWLPRERLFGTWDCDHWTLKVFRGVGWPDIVASPAAYINAQWDVDDELGSRLCRGRIMSSTLEGHSDMRRANQRDRGDGGIPSRSQFESHWPAAPHHDR